MHSWPRLPATAPYDQDSLYRAVTNRDPDALDIVPPGATAVPSETAETKPTQRDQRPSLAVTRRERRLNCSPGLAIAVASTRPATSVALAFVRPTIDNRSRTSACALRLIPRARL